MPKVDPEREIHDDEDATNEGVSATDPAEGSDDTPGGHPGSASDG